MKHELIKLPYAFGDLEPYIDAQTMEIHYTKHHQAYADKFNAALEKYPQLQEKSVEEILSDLGSIPEDIKDAVQNNGGGYYNHNVFWQCMTKDAQPKPSEELLGVITKTFGDFDVFKEQFSNAAKTHFGSGWAWLVQKKDDVLEIMTTKNQDTPISQGKSIILGLDVWEHAYYLKYQNKRANYVDEWWNVVNWQYAQDNFKA